MQWWRHSVKELSIAPSEAWRLDYVELLVLSEIESKSTQDLSFTVNAQREMNGCKRSQLKNINKV
jgi:hypothetical protein